MSYAHDLALEHAARRARLMGGTRRQVVMRREPPPPVVESKPKPAPVRKLPPLVEVGPEQGRFRVPPKLMSREMETPAAFKFPFVNRVGIIQDIVGSYYGLRRREMLLRCRVHRITVPRQVAEYLAKELTHYSLPEIGRRFGGRDHTTVLHSIRKVTRMIADAPEFAREVATIKDACDSAIAQVAQQRGADAADGQ